MGAALAEMAARFSDADDGAATAAALRERVLTLAQADADAYAAFLATRDEAARARTVDVPLEIAAIGSEVGELAARLAEDGNPNLRGDAITAALAGAAGARAAAQLVEINLQGRADDRLDRARAHASAASAAADRASL
jgi:methenyltetrahydrofolate cyclohydrolase